MNRKKKIKRSFRTLFNNRFIWNSIPKKRTKREKMREKKRIVFLWTYVILVLSDTIPHIFEPPVCYTYNLHQTEYDSV